MKNFAKKTLVLSTFTFAAGAANAAAFQLQEVTTSGLGRAYAGEAAIADNAGVVATNPALMTQFKRPEISLGGIWVNPGVDIEGKMSVPAYGIKNINTGYSDAIASKLLPNFYWVYPIDQKFTIGGGVNVNYGLATEYDENYKGGIMGGTTDLTSINLNLSGAYRLNDHWSFGLGVNAVYAKADLERRVGALADAINKKLGVNPKLKPSSYATDLQGKDWGLGWNAGVTYDLDENNRWGLAYHSKVKIKFDGDLQSDLPEPFGKSGDGSVEMNLPDFWEFSGYHKLTSQWAVHYSYKFTKWSRLQRISAFTDDNSTIPVFDKVEHFGDTSRVSIGTTYDVNDKLTLRAGIAHDEGAAGKKSSISIPDTHRMWYSVGATYKFTPDLSVDVGYTHVRGKKRSFTEVDEIKGIEIRNEVVSRAQVNLYGLNVNYRF
ncbi:MAG: outer membrane protein transport protein [[Actinobacillus] rossii]|uniref:Aromatic hydrocarbon degradation membrane protein n=1 Tax=Actinobacillus porcinus TaxID=51048 RepID=A0ABY6TLE1_9PAST|nr:porin [Actinobacillus porcinus]MDD7569108.1 outer membrane protein transport protein [[Actinobacillus] rossii]MDY5793089.1 outer membrane protein transport protein [[Actinobacillus] rossii]VFY93753.1 aromatic hydrocarbon degradation membrane protein [Actinobacillus porcinus]VTU09062.1 aromatic hydrocarbon degradation membrane protein [Actinobacillus porcinus]